MSLTLTSIDLDRLDTALGVLLSPLPDDGWRAAVHRAIRPLLDGDDRRAPSSAVARAIDRELGILTGLMTPAASRRVAAPLGARDATLLRLLRPVLRAAARRRRDGRRAPTTLRRFVNALSWGVAMYDAAGTLVHLNPALARLWTEDPERDHLAYEVARVARLVLARADTGTQRPTGGDAPEHELRSATARYVMHGVYTGADVDAGSCVAMFVERAPADAHGEAELSSRYRLTPRELHVARLLAAGRSTTEVARALGISIHTTRRHAEALLTKLGVHSRGAAVARLRSV